MPELFDCLAAQPQRRILPLCHVRTNPKARPRLRQSRQRFRIPGPVSMDGSQSATATQSEIEKERRLLSQRGVAAKILRVPVQRAWPSARPVRPLLLQLAVDRLVDDSQGRDWMA